MDIKVRNCNCIDEANLSIQENKLNIKYGPNGTGKSTIARAIGLSISGKEMSSLVPFKYRNAEESVEKPAVEGCENLKSIMVFNEDFINQFVFQEDDLIKNSFEIFIKTNEYDNQMAAIESRLSEIRQTFEKNEILVEVIDDLMQLSSCFGKPTKDKPFHGSSAIGKSIAKGNKLANIPETLKPYSDFLKSEENVAWIGWQMKGNAFLDLSDACPFCTSSTEHNKEVIRSVSKEFDPKSIENLNNLKEVFEKLKKYFTEDAQKIFSSLFNNSTEITTEGTAFLKSVKASVDALYQKLSNLHRVSFFALKDVDKVIDKISSFKIDMTFLPDLKSPETLKIVDEVNACLDKVLAEAGKLQGEVAKQKRQIEETIKVHKTDINNFLTYAGYKYTVDIVLEEDRYIMKLLHQDAEEAFTDGNEHLSFGERNAFSILLFMYQCLRDKPDLIILDDPISSFDKNKKFALVEVLFRKESGLKGKTVLMLTHDLEPIIDMIYTKSSTFGQGTVASFLSSRNGIVGEIPILRHDILSFSRICEEIIGSAEDEIIKLVYLRRLLEVWNDKGLSYQLISNLLHKREAPEFKEGDQVRPMTTEEIKQAVTDIQKQLSSFDYKRILTRIKDDNQMTELYIKTGSHHSKLQIFRIMKQDKTHESDIIAKFINETFHIENDYIMQLHPAKYEIIPSFIIDECNQILFEKQQ